MSPDTVTFALKVADMIQADGTLEGRFTATHYLFLVLRDLIDQITERPPEGGPFYGLIRSTRAIR